jgi:RNA polymerase sigma-70 factor (ECF subfamily)
VADTVADPTVEKRTADARLEVLQALHQLDPEDRDLLILIDVEEYSYLEASEVIGISESAVRSRLHRARKALLEVLNNAE